MSNISINTKHKRALRSIETKRLTDGTTSLDKPFYISQIVSGQHIASIFNDTEPKEKHYINGIETSTPQFNRGDSFTGCFYDEGCDHTYSFLLKDMGYATKLGFDAYIERTVSGICVTQEGIDCTATSIYTIHTVDNVGNLTYSWTCIGGTINGSSTDRSVSISSSGISNVDIELTCVVSDQYTQTTVMYNDVHIHRNSYSEPVINGISIDQIGSCTYDSSLGGSDCTATTVFSVDTTNATSFLWSIDNGVISSGQGTNTISVDINSDKNEYISGICCVSNGHHTISEKFFSVSQHIDTNVPLNVLNIVEAVPGSCEYNTGSTCTATSSYTVKFEGHYTSIVWECIGGTIISGQGTESVQISTDSNVDTSFDLRITMSNTVDTSIMTRTFVHTRTENQYIFDRHITYDTNNIAQEFIA